MKSLRLPTAEPNKAWVLVDEGNPFLETQCLSIAETMDFPAHLHRISLSWVWRHLPLCFIPDLMSKIHSVPTPFASPWPSFVVCGGRVALKVGMYLKKKYGVFSVAVGQARSSFDKIILESNLSEERGRKIMTFGPLHRIYQDSLLHARQTFYRKVDPLPKPRVSLFLEGQENLESLINILASLHKKNAFSLMIYAENLSEGDQKYLTEAFEKIPHLLWCGNGEDPYLGFLAHSEAIIMRDNASLMLAEATAVGKPLFMYPSRRLNSYGHALIQAKRASLLTQDSFLFSRSLLAPLQESQRVGALLKRAYLRTRPSSPLNLS